MDIKDVLQSDEGKAALEAAVAEVTGGLKAKRDELLETNRRLKSELAERQGEAAKTVGRLEQAEGMVQRLLVDAGLTEALGKARVAPEFIEAARALIKANETITLGEADGQPTALIGEKPLERFVADWSESERGRHFLAPAANSGGGAAGGGGGGGVTNNPWAKGGRNLSEQARLLREDPALAQRLKTDAARRAGP